MAQDWQPAWTTEVRIESGGRYPLGENRLHDGLDTLLIKGIIEAANRLRYISYCCWALGDIQKNCACPDYPAFVDAFRRRENALALGLLMNKPDYTVYGSDTMSKFVDASKQSYDCSAFKLMQSVTLGAYELYYQGTIYNWGLVQIDESGFVTLTKDGSKIYEIMDRYYAELKPQYYTKYRGAKDVPVDVLKEWAEANHFHNIREGKHTQEREFYKSILFRLDHGASGDYRPHTLAFVLNCIDTCSANNTTFSEDVLRNINFYKQYRDDNGDIQTFCLPDYYDDVHFYWMIYEGHVYFRWWLSRYFDLFQTHLKAARDGSTVDEFMAAISRDGFNAEIESLCGKPDDFANASMEDVLKMIHEEASNIESPLSVESLTNAEKAVLSAKKATLASSAARFLLVCAGLYCKFNEVKNDVRYRDVNIKRQDDLWFEKIRGQHNLLKMKTMDFLRMVLKNYVITQHDRVMIEKRDLRRCWFTVENNRYFHKADVSLIWRPAKYNTIHNFLIDMRLADVDFSSLTDDGDIFYKKLVKEFFSHETN